MEDFGEFVALVHGRDARDSVFLKSLDLLVIQCVVC